MICPRCSAGQISEVTHECTLCGFAPPGGARGGVLLEAPADSSTWVLERRFHVEAPLRRTATSVVYLARDEALGRLVAVKVIPVQATMGTDIAGRFQQAIATAGTLDHPHIVPVHHSGVSATALWYSMEYYACRSLDEILRAAGPLERGPCLRKAQQIASALDYAHRRGVMHGNLRPSNVLVDADGWVRVTDFAVARAIGPAWLQHPGDDPGKALGHMAPEFFATRNLAGPSADQYALACLVHECLTGTPPFAGESAEEVVERLRAEPAPSLSTLRPDVPPQVADAVRRALSKEPTNRFASVLDFVTALEDAGAPPRVVRTTPSGRSPAPARVVDIPAPLPRPAPRRRSHRFAIVATVLALGLGLAALTLWWSTPQAPSASPPLRDTVEVAASEAAASLSDTAATQPAERAALPASDTAPSPEPPSQAPPPPPVAVGYLSVNATPWGQVVVDGRTVGNTPRLGMTLPAGTHRLRVVRDGFEPYERIVQIAPGATLRITDIVLRKGAP